MKVLPHVVMLALVLTAACTKNQQYQTVKQSQESPKANISVASDSLGQAQAVTTLAAAQVTAPPVTPLSTTEKTTATEKAEGPFQLGDQSFTFVKRILSIDRQPHNPDDETVDWWEIRRGSGSVVYHQAYGPVTFESGTFAETTWVDARALKTQFGKGLAVEGEDLPSAPNSGSWVQVFGIFNGKLVPFGPKIGTDGEFDGETIDSFTPSIMFKGQQPQKVERDVLDFKVWTGDFSIIYPVLVDWTAGNVRPAWRCLRMTPHGQLERCRYKIEVEPHRTQTDLTFVRLFQEPEQGLGTPAHVVIKPDSKIDYLEAEVPVHWVEQKDFIFINASGGTDDIWLHVKIDGQEGWIHTEEDFQAVGLEQSG